MSANRPRLIFSDFDGTLTQESELGPEFFRITRLAAQHQIPFIIVTGRSVQWSFFTLTHLSSLQFSIAEGGGVWVEKKGAEDMALNYLVTKDERERLEQFSQKLQNRFGVSLTSDSLGRVTDRALDLNLFANNPNLKQEITALMDEENIHHSTSSVHLNFWVGEISKAQAIKALMAARFADISLDEVIYFGDSLNDQSVFAEFPHTVGVSNIDRVWDILDHRPKLRLSGPENAGPLGVLAQLSNLLK